MILNISDIKSSVAIANNVSNKPYESILISTINNKLVITGTNGTYFIVSSVADTEEEISPFCINPSELYRALSRVTTEEIDMNFDDESVIKIKSGRAKYQVQKSESISFPITPIVDGEGVDISVSDIKKVKFAVSTIKGRGALNCVALTPKYIAASDGYFASVLNKETKLNSVIPPEAISIISMLESDIVKVCDNDNFIKIYSDRHTFITKKLSLKFPDVIKVFPTQFEHTLKVEKNDIEDLIETSCVFESKDAQNNLSSFEFSPGRLKVTQKSGKNESTNEIDLEHDINYILNIDFKRALQIIKSFQTKNIFIKFNKKERSPVIFSDEQGIQSCLLMPVVKA